MESHSKIRLLRIAKGYSQEWIAKCLVISQNQYSKIERGIKPISKEMETKILELLSSKLPAQLEQPLDSKTSLLQLFYELQLEDQYEADTTLLDKFIAQRESLFTNLTNEIALLKKIRENIAAKTDTQMQGSK
ncbi:MAG: helix-turn-helix domain-containing protein [Bacteroidia bacterium]|jgi:transcriptional regulator with XRE-family HTH domain|nr:helix-turn-helix domain-containing protein [Bacteroidia bacterium]